MLQWFKDNSSTPTCSTVNNVKKHIFQKTVFKPFNIEHISIDSNIALSDDSSYLFARLYNLQDITGLDKVDTGKTEYVDHMFFKDKKLTQLDLSSWDARSFYYEMENMFSSDTSLTEINLKIGRAHV